VLTDNRQSINERST